jgi:hypothetical protein
MMMISKISKFPEDQYVAKIDSKNVIDFSAFTTEPNCKSPDETKDQPLFNRTINFLKVKWILWAWHYIKSRLGGKWTFQDYENYDSENGIYELRDLFDKEKKEEDVRISLIGDWGSAIKEAYDVAQAVLNDAPHFTIHLGDIYYVGTKKEVENNMLGQMVMWPIGSCGSFALNANHEMYARGKGYFKYLLPSLGLRKSKDQECAGQKASFFV